MAGTYPMKATRVTRENVMTSQSRLLAMILALLFTPISSRADGLDATLQGRVDAEVKKIEEWVKEPAVIQAVQAHNAGPSADVQAMTQDKWKTLTVLDPFVRGFTKNAVAEILRSKKSDVISEAFVSGADGTKVAFLAKTSNWSHKGKPKHDQPMAGKKWQGAAELDESTGLQQIQVAIPVVDNGKPIGSLVVGLSLTKLGKE